MEIDEIIRRLERIAQYGTHYPGEPLLVLSLDDGVALKEAIELLKEQRAVPPLWQENKPHCGQCGEWLFGKMNFCTRCGKAVKWDE